jgi:ubiquinone/menaquinone biosynthesis C-methylase UbiE
MQNYSIKEQIRDYWSTRASSYDAGRGHGIEHMRERPAWLALIGQHLGPGASRKALDLATGTGEIALLLHEAGFDVTGIDFAEPMLDRARSKALQRGASIRFLMRDVDETHEPDASYDVLVTRNLVWTLVDPTATFAEWHRLLKPGGRLLIVDADHVSQNWADRLHKEWCARFGDASDDHALVTEQQRNNHQEIVQQVHFARGARAPEVQQLLARAGFANFRCDLRMRRLREAQWFGGPWTGRLCAHVRHRFTISCVKLA